MDFGLNVVPVRLEELVEVARRAEQLGFESLWVGEHVLSPVEIAGGYPGATGGPATPGHRGGPARRGDPAAVPGAAGHRERPVHPEGISERGQPRRSR